MGFTLNRSLPMSKFSVLTTILLQLLCMLMEISCQNGCFQYFTYITDPSTREVLGQVLIPFPPLNVDLHLKVGLSIAVRLPTSNVGEIGLAQSKADSVRAVEQGKPLLYHIHFPLSQPLAVITGIWFNNQLYCTGSNTLGSVVTSIVLEHSLYPSRRAPDFTTSTTEFTTRRPTTTLSPKPDQNNNECGRSFTNITSNELISKKVKISPGEWPWLVAIFYIENMFTYLCVGTLLTNRHVLTAAHCLTNEKGINIPPALILTSFGRYRLTDWEEKESVNRLIKNYTIYPGYQFKNTDSNLAILFLNDSLPSYNPNIKPICLWSGPSDLQRVVGKSGYVVGWTDELGNQFTVEPRMSRAPIVSQENCLLSNRHFGSLTSPRTFCAGILRSGSGPCSGDSGSGLMLYNSITGHYELRGVVSALPLIFDNGTFSCNFKHYVNYVDVAKHTDWIKQQISTK